MNGIERWEKALDAVGNGKLGLSTDGLIRLHAAIHAQICYLVEITPDVTVQDEGSIVVLYLNTETARTWVRDHVNTENAQWWAGNGLVVEHRYADGLIDGLQADGLEVQ
jgi:hypothetical protein